MNNQPQASDRPPDPAVIVSVRDVRIRFGEHVVLDGLSLDIRTGESIVIAGPSGCGKSVFLKTVLGLIEPDSGAISIKGTEIVGLSGRPLMDIRGFLGVVFQNSALFDSLTVWENVGFSLLYHSSESADTVRAKAREVLAAVGLEDIEERMPEQLSGGMKKRVSIARALISRPEMLFYDEPTTGLDPITSEHITKLMEQIHKRFGTTDITVTHDVKLASRIADRIVLLEHGRVDELGTFAQLRETSKSPLIRSYLEAFACEE